MRGALRYAQTLKTLWVAQHLAPLLGHSDTLTGERVLPRHAACTHLLGFLPRGQTAYGREAKRKTTRILRLAHPMPLGHPEKRCEGIGADRHADVIQPEGRGGLSWEAKRGSTLPAQCSRGHRVNQRLAVRPGGVRASLRFDHLLARTQTADIASKARDEGCARGQLLQARPQRASGRGSLGAAGW